MKTIPLVFVAILATAATVRSQETEAAISRESTTAPVTSITTARILGNIPDGTPPPPEPPKPKFWSSADFALIAGGIQSFVDSAQDTHCMFMGRGSVDIDRMTDLLAAKGRVYAVPDMPILPAGKATYQIVGNQPAAEELVPIQSLHDLYNSELQRLKTAYEGRELARIAHEAYLKAHAPQPKDFTLHYWRTIIGKLYTLFLSPDLSAGSWITVGESFIGTGNINEHKILLPTSDKLFWRVSVTDTDSDGDLLTNAEEGVLETNPNSPDTDGDGVSDADEITRGTDAKSAASFTLAWRKVERNLAYDFNSQTKTGTLALNATWNAALNTSESLTSPIQIL